ncbi:hypothetical protein Q9Q99_13905 [Curtobacterium flaccumfaciens]|nr:hypothetical protein Q9Q99_13905 [Curtobacterium flaccumfaciens]
MGLYLLLAAQGARRLDQVIPDLDGFVTDLVGSWQTIDPGADYFLSGIAYSYLVQTADFTGRRDLVTDEMLTRMVQAFTGLEGDAAGPREPALPVLYARSTCSPRSGRCTGCSSLTRTTTVPARSSGWSGGSRRVVWTRATACSCWTTR